MKQNADKQLANRILEGDQRSFDAFFNAYYQRLYRFALVRLGNDVDLADETAQTVLCQAISKLHTYRGEAPLFSWLCTFCRYELSRQRKARDRAQGDQPLAEDNPEVRSALDSLLATTGDDPELSVHQAEIRRTVKVAMDNIPSMYADVLEFKYVKDLSVNDIAELIGKSPKAAESILTRARNAFKESFKSIAAERPDATTGSKNLTSLLEY